MHTTIYPEIWFYPQFECDIRVLDLNNITNSEKKKNK